MAIGTRAESPVSNVLTRKLLSTVFIAVSLSGLLVVMGSVLAFIWTAKEDFLYAPVHGIGALAAAVAVSAHQVAGETAVLPVLPWLHYSHLPLLVVLSRFAKQYMLKQASNDAVLTVLSLLLSWIILRWMYPYATGSVGDTRDAFDFLSMLPEPIRCVTC